MKDLIKVMLVLALFFASTFLIIKSTGVITADGIKDLLYQVKQHQFSLMLIVVALLFADLFIAVPTMTVTILAGYFIGWPMAILACLTGFYLAGITGYFISRIYGYQLLEYIYRDRQRLDEMHTIYSRFGTIILIICRAMPILPEVSCCMAGATKMSFARFFTAYSLGTIPYALIITYAGSISSLDKPTPAIIAGIAVSLILWSSWYLLSKKLKNDKV